MSETPLLGLPLMESSQAQKHITHNEALLLLDAAIHLSVVSRSLAAPPAAPNEGDRYLVAAPATGGWVGEDGNLAIREASAWRFSVPRSGWRLWVEDEFRFFVYDGAAWHDLQQIERTGGAAGNGTTDDTVALQSVLSAGKTVILGHGKSYLITARLLITAAGTGIVGDGTSRLIMSTAAGHFDNVNTGPDRYDIHGVGVYAEAIDRPVVKGFRIAPDVYVDGRRVRAVALKSCTNITVDGIEAWGFSLCGGVITINGSTLGSVSGNFIHDCYSDHASGGQLTGITIDADAVTDSSGLRLAGNKIVDLTVGANFIAGTGYDVTGIHFEGRQGALFAVTGNYIENVGQGFDIYCVDSIFTGNTVVDVYTSGFALKHGASRNILSKNLVNGAGLRGVFIAGGSTAGDTDTADNQIEGNTIRRVGFNGAYATSQTSGIGWTAGTVGNPSNNRIFNNALDGGGTGKYGIYSNAGAGSGNEASNNHVTNFTVADYDVAAGTAAYVTMPGDFPPADGDKGGISVSSSGLAWTINANAVDQDALVAGYDLSNLVANGTLEKGDYGFSKQAGWTVENDPANALAGYWVARHADTSNTSYELRSNSIAAVSPGDRVSAEAWVKTSASPVIATLRVSIRWLDKDKAQLSNTTGTNYTSEQLSYVLSSVTGVAPAGAAYAQIAVQSKKSAGTIWVDRITARAAARLGSGTADSTTFLRGDNTWAAPSGGGGGDGPAFDPLTSIAGVYGGPTNIGAVSASSTMAANWLYLTRLKTNAAMTITELGLYIQTAGAAGSKVRLGLYSALASGLPAALLADSGELATDTAAAFVSNASLSQAIAAKTDYWLAALFSGTPAVMGFGGSSATPTIGWNANGSANMGRSGMRFSQSYGALPADLSSASWQLGTLNMPIVLWK